MKLREGRGNPCYQHDMMMMMIYFHTTKWFQVLQCITNNSIKHRSFVYIQLINQRVLFQKIQFSISWEDKGVHAFPKGICPKVNVIVRLEYRLTYYDSAVHCFNHYTTRTPPQIICLHTDVFKYCYLTVTIQLSVSHLFTYS